MISSKLLVAATLAAALAASGCAGGRSAPIENVQEAPYGISASGSKQLSRSDYEAAIIRAGAGRGWVFERVAPGHLVGTVVVRGKHTAVVDIYYDAEDFSIVYKDSENLNYNPEKHTIHPNYNSWVSLLEQDIRKEVQIARAG